MTYSPSCPFCYETMDFETKREMDRWFRQIWKRFRHYAQTAVADYAENASRHDRNRGDDL